MQKLPIENNFKLELILYKQLSSCCDDKIWCFSGLNINARLVCDKCSYRTFIRTTEKLNFRFVKVMREKISDCHNAPVVAFINNDGVVKLVCDRCNSVCLGN